MDGLAQGTVEFIAQINKDDHPSLSELQPLLAQYVRIHEQDAADVRALGARIAELEQDLATAEMCHEASEEEVARLRELLERARDETSPRVRAEIDSALRGEEKL
ncbi:MAG: hypothetical protein ACYTGV_20465 [Planctomycetota bacterium]|jgi:hypothetical protein